MFLIKMIDTVKFAIPLCYLAVGGMLLAGLFGDIGMAKQILFGGIIILYGCFRMYSEYRKLRKKRGER
jgi:hypothetical protein